MSDTTFSSAVTAPAPADEPGTAAACRRLATLDPDARYVTIVSTYSIALERAEPLMQLLSSAAEKILRHLPGFVSLNLHLSSDRARVVSYSQWRTREAVAGARGHPGVAALINEASEMADCVTRVRYELRYSLAMPVG